MPTFRGEHLNDKVLDVFDSEGANTDDGPVTSVATKKNAPVGIMSNVSPLLIVIQIEASVTNLST